MEFIKHRYANIPLSEEYTLALKNSKGQLNQDVFVLLQSNFKKNGYFVEFGASDGIGLSNTFLLEKDFGWTGIVAEPARVWKDSISKNRKCHVDHRCVWKNSGEKILFRETDALHISTIDSFSNCDMHAALRRSGKTYQVETVSLEDLLKTYNAPNTIDYLSIDTEGSEYDILSSFDFSKYDIKIITCEHNHTANRKKTFELLTSNGYSRCLENFSDFDDWYVKG